MQEYFSVLTPLLREEQTVRDSDWEHELRRRFFDRHCTELNESTSEGKGRRERGRAVGQEGAYGELRLCDQTTMGQQLESTLE